MNCSSSKIVPKVSNDEATSAGIKVIGAGLGRTGTLSLQKALKILKYDPCYHMSEIHRDVDAMNFWIKLSDGQTTDFAEAFGPKNYSATCDFPAAVYWKQLFEHNPNAKVILTIRDPEAWYDSFAKTILSVLPEGPMSSLGTRVTLASGFPNPKFSEMLSKVIIRDTFHNDLSKANIIKSFINHNEHVIQCIPSHQLLIFDIRDGWEPLCQFLDKPIPDEPFPNCNEASHFVKFRQFMSHRGYVLGALGLGIPFLFVMGNRTKYIRKDNDDTGAWDENEKKNGMMTNNFSGV